MKKKFCNKWKVEKAAKDVKKHLHFDLYRALSWVCCFVCICVDVPSNLKVLWYSDEDFVKDQSHDEKARSFVFFFSLSFFLGSSNQGVCVNKASI